MSNPPPNGDSVRVAQASPTVVGVVGKALTEMGAAAGAAGAAAGETLIGASFVYWSASGGVRVASGSGCCGSQAVVEAVQAAIKPLERTVEALAKGPGGMRKGGVLSDNTAQRIFDLMRRLEPDPKKKKAQLLTVFRITVLDRRTQKEAATLCKCRESLMSRRVEDLEKEFGMSIEELRYYGSQVLDLESSVKGERNRKKALGARPAPDEGESVGDGEGDFGQEELEDEKEDAG